ncbi:MAG: hypothetical protein ABIE47_03560 [Pseudomonadota bacterium]
MKPEIRNSKSPRPALDAGYWMLDTGCWILDTGYWILDTGYWILDEPAIRNLKPATRNLQEAALVRELSYRPETIIRKFPGFEMKA